MTTRDDLMLRELTGLARLMERQIRSGRGPRLVAHEFIVGIAALQERHGLPLSERMVRYLEMHCPTG